MGDTEPERGGKKDGRNVCKSQKKVKKIKARERDKEKRPQEKRKHAEKGDR